MGLRTQTSTATEAALTQLIFTPGLQLCGGGRQRARAAFPLNKVKDDLIIYFVLYFEKDKV